MTFGEAVLLIFMCAVAWWVGGGGNADLREEARTLNRQVAKLRRTLEKRGADEQEANK